jgi:hypothetical protein
MIYSNRHSGELIQRKQGPNESGELKCSHIDNAAAAIR